MYIVFRGVENNVFNSPHEAIMGMFIMSLGEFADIYESFNHTPYSFVPKVIYL